jgi:alkylation response protein AidB-like acyl-CoA dehydrogenase
VAVGFDLTDEQRLFRDAVVEFAQRELGSGLVRDHDPSAFRERWRACARLGLQGLPVPIAYGGQGADPLTAVVALEALGYGCSDNGLIFSLNAHMWAVQMPIVRFGTEEQKRRYLTRLCDGSWIAAFAATEPGSGSDALGLTTSATPHGDRYVLNGSKTFITNAPEADLFVVLATTNPGLRFGGLCAFLVERDAPGFEIGPAARKMGLESAPMSDLAFDSCEVPASQMLASPGAGMAVFNTALHYERGFIVTSTIGTMQRQLERCIEYARERRQFGRPIADFQAVSHRIANMKVRLETARLVAYRFGALVDRGEDSAVDSALTKLHLSECFLQSSLDALQIHGGYGYMAEYGLERDVRDAIAARIYSGTSELQRSAIARGLGL